MIIEIIWSDYNSSFGMRVKYNLKINTVIQNGGLSLTFLD